MNWQLDRLGRLLAWARSEEAVASLWVRGSGATPGSLDVWSDLDVTLAVGNDLDLPPVIRRLGDPWALESAQHGNDWTCRVVFEDGNRLDLRVIAASSSEEDLSAKLLLHRQVPLSVCPPHVVLPRPTCATVNRVRFLAAMSVVKLGRGDRLIGTHLALEVARETLVQGMLLRDRDEQRTHHRLGTRRDDTADQLISILSGEDVVTGWLAAVTALFSRLHEELEPTCPDPSWTPLDALLRRHATPDALDRIESGEAR